MKNTQDIVIVGAGIAGASAAYHLAKLGAKNITVIESEKAGGLYSIVSAAMTMHQNGIPKLTELAKYSISTYKNFKKDTDCDVGFHETGSLLFSTTSKGAEELKNYTRVMSAAGIKSSYLTNPNEIARKAKLLDTGGIKASSYCGLDGYVDASRVMKFYFQEAVKMGVKILEWTKVIGVLKSNGRVEGVKMNSGETIYTQTLVDCAGCYSKDLGLLAGLNIPIKANKRDLAIVKPLRFIDYHFPILENLDEGWYFRPFQFMKLINLVLIGVAPSRWIEDRDRKPHPSFDTNRLPATKNYILY